MGYMKPYFRYKSSSVQDSILHRQNISSDKTSTIAPKIIKNNIIHACFFLPEKKKKYIGNI